MTHARSAHRGVKHGSDPHTGQLRAYLDEQSANQDAAALLLAPRKSFENLAAPDDWSIDVAMRCQSTNHRHTATPLTSSLPHQQTRERARATNAPGGTRGRYEAPSSGADAAIEQVGVTDRGLTRAAQVTRCRRGLGNWRRPTFAHGRPSTITTSAVKSFSPRISEEPTP